MGKAYNQQEREEALKLAREIGAAAAGQRLGISADTIYTWQSKARNKADGLPSSMEEGELKAEVEKLRKKLREQEEEIEILQDALGFFRQAPKEVAKVQRVEYTGKHKVEWHVTTMCRVLDVSESGYYKHLRRQQTDRDEKLLAQIYELLQEDEENANYGVRRIFLALKNQSGYTGGYRRILRLCRENNLMIHRKQPPHGITRADAQAQKSENLLQQDFSASKPNEKWLTDITEVPCKDGKLYLAAILDCFDGSIRGFQIDNHMCAELCVAAFLNACRQDGAKGMILHSDRGSQFTSTLFRKALFHHKALQSMSGVGRCFDNARMESFFATLKKEKLYRLDTSLLSRAQVTSIIIRYIAYYNFRRVYTPNGGWPPMIFRQFAAYHAA